MFQICYLFMFSVLSETQKPDVPIEKDKPTSVFQFGRMFTNTILSAAASSMTRIVSSSTNTPHTDAEGKHILYTVTIKKDKKTSAKYSAFQFGRMFTNSILSAAASSMTRIVSSSIITLHTDADGKHIFIE